MRNERARERPAPGVLAQEAPAIQGDLGLGREHPACLARKRAGQAHREGELPGASAGSSYDQIRYNPAMRKIWPWPAVLLERVAEWMDRLPGEVWLDAACGEGHLGGLLAGRKSLVGLDLDDERLRPARRRACPECFDFAQHRPCRRAYRLLVRGSVTSIPLADASVSGIASVETLEHIVDLDGALREFARCLGPGGFLIVTVPSVTLRSLRQMRRTGRPVYCDEKEHVREFSSVAIEGFPHMFETWAQFEDRLRRHGFDIARADGVGFVLPEFLGWRTRLTNLLSREAVNRWLGVLPGIRRFPYYRLYVLQCGGGDRSTTTNGFHRRQKTSPLRRI